MNRSGGWSVLLIWTVCALLTGCTTASGNGARGTAVTPSPAGTPVPTAVPTLDAATQFQNPVLRANFPDPHIIEVDGIYYAYATNGTSRNVQMAQSNDLVDWELMSDAMPSMGSWAQLGGSYVWAPEVMQIGDRFVLYYTARDKEADRQCVGVAVADSPEGKFRDENDAALVCQVDEGGTIDAHPFRDADGTLYLYYKNDGNCCSIPTYIYVQEMAADGLSLVGEPVRLVRNDAAWEGNVIEAPTMWIHDGRYYLFYSANSYGGFEYAVGYATCETALGPCMDAPENPILRSTREVPLVIGPGHQTIVVDPDGDEWMVYHQWAVSSAGTKTDQRYMSLDPLLWEDGVPRVAGPNMGPQPKP